MTKEISAFLYGSDAQIFVSSNSLSMISSRLYYSGNGNRSTGLRFQIFADRRFFQRRTNAFFGIKINMVIPSPPAAWNVQMLRLLQPMVAGFQQQFDGEPGSCDSMLHEGHLPSGLITVSCRPCRMVVLTRRGMVRRRRQSVWLSSTQCQGIGASRCKGFIIPGHGAG